MSVFLRWSRQCETRDDHFDPDLKSHYYKASFNKVFKTVLEMFQNNPNVSISSASEERGEIGIHMNRKPKSFIVATVIQVRPFETAVDFKISTEVFAPLGIYPKLKKYIQQFYMELDKNLPFKETK